MDLTLSPKYQKLQAEVRAFLKANIDTVAQARRRAAATEQESTGLAEADHRGWLFRTLDP